MASMRERAIETGRNVTDWMEERTGIVSMTQKFLYEPVPRKGKWLYSLGSASLF